MGMYSAKSYALTSEEFNYLLPVLRGKLLGHNGSCHFVGDTDSLDDMLSRLKGLYGHFDDINPTVNYLCFRSATLAPFRELVSNKQ